jgi:hypothetical protein
MSLAGMNLAIDIAIFERFCHLPNERRELTRQARRGIVAPTGFLG